MIETKQKIKIDTSTSVGCFVPKYGQTFSPYEKQYKVDKERNILVELPDKINIAELVQSNYSDCFAVLLKRYLDTEDEKLKKQLESYTGVASRYSTVGFGSKLDLYNRVSNVAPVNDIPVSGVAPSRIDSLLELSKNVDDLLDRYEVPKNYDFNKSLEYIVNKIKNDNKKVVNNSEEKINPPA